MLVENHPADAIAVLQGGPGNQGSDFRRGDRFEVEPGAEEHGVALIQRDHHRAFALLPEHFGMRL